MDLQTIVNGLFISFIRDEPDEEELKTCCLHASRLKHDIETTEFISGGSNFTNIVNVYLRCELEIDDDGETLDRLITILAGFHHIKAIGNVKVKGDLMSDYHTVLLYLLECAFEIIAHEYKTDEITDHDLDHETKEYILSFKNLCTRAKAQKNLFINLPELDSTDHKFTNEQVTHYKIAKTIFTFLHKNATPDIRNTTIDTFLLVVDCAIACLAP